MARKKLREDCAVAMEKMGVNAQRADNGDVINVSRRGVKSAEPATKGKPLLVGLKTLQGTSWLDRYYLQVNAPQKIRRPQPSPRQPQQKNTARGFLISTRSSYQIVIKFTSDSLLTMLVTWYDAVSWVCRACISA